jgi:carbohydrate-selective porin OprB
LTWTGPFEERDQDILGLGVARVSFSERFPLESHETALELFYTAAVSDRVLIQPDLQYIANPIANGRDAFVIGLRFEASL